MNNLALFLKKGKAKFLVYLVKAITMPFAIQVTGIDEISSSEYLDININHRLTLQQQIIAVYKETSRFFKLPQRIRPNINPHAT